MKYETDYTIFVIGFAVSVKGGDSLKPKILIKLVIDFSMTILLLCQMAYLLIGETIHEWTGSIMFVLFLLHNILNRKWYRNVFKGNYPIMRIFQTIINVLLIFSMIGLMISGIMLSRVVFAFLPIEGGMSFARTLHMLAAYWGFILMSIHLGLHWRMILGVIRKVFGNRKQTEKAKWVLRGSTVFFCGMGIYAFQKNHIADYLFIKSQFVFFDTEQLLILFFAENLAMMILWAGITYYVVQMIQKMEIRKKGEEKWKN